MSEEQHNSIPSSPPFAVKLMAILANICYFDIISWLPHGRGFLIHNKNRFAAEVLPIYFGKGLQYASFTRRLTRWGFRRIKRGHDIGVYHHPLFRKDNPKLCLKMPHCTVKSPKNDLSDPDFYTEDDNTLNYLRDEDSSQEASRRKVIGGHVGLENTIIQNKNTATKNSKMDMIASTHPSPSPLPNTTTSSVSIAAEGNSTPFSSSTTSAVKSQETRNDLFDDIALLNTTKQTTTNSLAVTGTMLSQSTKNTAQIRGTSSATPISSSRMSNAHRQQLIFPGSSTSTATLFETPSNKATTKILPTTTTSSTSAVIRPDFCSSSHLPLHSQIQQQPLLVVRQQIISFPPMAYSSNPTTRIGGQTIITPQETLASLAQQTIPLLNLQQPTMVVQPKHYLNGFSPSATTSLVTPQQQEPTNMNPFQSLLDVIRNQHHGPPLPPDQILPSLISTYDITSTTHPDLPHFCSDADISGQEKKQHM